LTKQVYHPRDEEIRRSVKSRLVVGLLVGSTIGLLVGLLNGLPNGLLVGLVVWMLSGLYDMMQHFILRFWLWKAQVFPWNAVAFLEDACERHLLQRIGDGYCFAHRLLLDYFADVKIEATPSANVTSHIRSQQQ
jgi:hypothetical protein